MTRRALLRRGAVVGAVVWTTPILQTALAPAASASHCVINCPVGHACSTTAPIVTCQSGLVCVAGICLINGGGTGCTANGQCASGFCNTNTRACLLWPGDSCTTNSQCTSGKCTGGRCSGNGLAGSCRTTNDCTDNTQCGPTKTCGGIGAPCANSQKCTTNNCQGGYCV